MGLQRDNKVAKQPETMEARVLLAPNLQYRDRDMVANSGKDVYGCALVCRVKIASCLYLCLVRQ